MSMKQRQKVLACVAAGIFALSLLIMFVAMRGGKSMPDLGPYYFSNDDGKTFFTLPEDRLAPFDHQGHEAAVAVLFADASNKPFVGYLAKLSPEGQQVLKKANWRIMANDGPVYTLVKRPGDASWVPALSREGKAVAQVIDKSTGQPARPYEPVKH